MTKQEQVKNSVITNIAKACPNLSCETAADLADDILKDEEALGVMIKTGVGEIVADSPCTIEVPIVEPLIEVKK